jgi:hypothetical protein
MGERNERYEPNLGFDAGDPRVGDGSGRASRCVGLRRERVDASPRDGMQTCSKQ